MRRFIFGVFAGILLTVLGVALALQFGQWRVDATAEPSDLERRVLHGVLDRALARQAPQATPPFTIGNERLLAGMKTYRQGCAGCHGGAAGRSTWGTTAFYPRAPQFGFDPVEHSDNEVFWIVKNGIRYTGMAAWSSLLTDEEIWEVSTFLTRIRSLPPPVAAEWNKRGRGGQPQ